MKRTLGISELNPPHSHFHATYICDVPACSPHPFASCRLFLSSSSSFPQDVKRAQKEWETKLEAFRAETDKQFVAGSLDRIALTERYQAAADELVAGWWQLADDLMFKYADGFVNVPGMIGQSVGYPSWWLEQVGYSRGPLAYSVDQPRIR